MLKEMFKSRKDHKAAASTASASLVAWPMPAPRGRWPDPRHDHHRECADADLRDGAGPPAGSAGLPGCADCPGRAGGHAGGRHEGRSDHCLVLMLYLKVVLFGL